LKKGRRIGRRKGGEKTMGQEEKKKVGGATPSSRPGRRLSFKN